MALSAQKTTDIQKQFDPMRRRVQQQETVQLQQQNDAITRRAAAAGGGPAGAFEKQRMLAADASARRLQEANEGVDAQQQAALNQAREIQEQRDFQTAERVAGQTFASGEREAGQAFSARESAMARELQKYGIDVNKALEEGRLTGTYGGQQTLAAKQAADQKALAEAGLTGMYGGQKTIQQKAMDEASTQQALENKINTGTTVATLLGNLKTLGYNPDQIKAIIGDLGLANLPGINIGDIGGVTVAPPPAPPKPTPAGGGRTGWVSQPGGGRPVFVNPRGR